MSIMDKESLPFIVTVVWFILVAINVNPTLGLIFIAFTLTSMVIYRWDSVRTTPLDRSKKWLMPFVQGILLYIGFVIISALLMPIFEQIPIGSLIQLLGATTPALSDSIILNTLTFVIFVPFAETIFFVILMDVLASKWNIDITRKGMFKLSTIMLIGGLAFLFLLYHISAKGVTNNAALMLVFVMMFVSLNSAVWFGESKQAIIFHQVANMFGIGLFASLIPAIGFIAIPVIGLFVLFSVKKFKTHRLQTSIHIKK